MNGRAYRLGLQLGRLLAQDSLQISRLAKGWDGLMRAVDEGLRDGLKASRKAAA